MSFLFMNIWLIKQVMCFNKNTCSITAIYITAYNLYCFMSDISDSKPTMLIEVFCFKIKGIQSMKYPMVIQIHNPLMQTGQGLKQYY